MNEILNKIKSTTTIGELNYLRPEIAKVMIDTDQASFGALQAAFIKRKNSLNRKPCPERGKDWYTIKEIGKEK